MPFLMGCSCAKGVREYIDNYNIISNRSNLIEHYVADSTKLSNDYYYIATALLTANKAASLVVHDICPGYLDQESVDQLIRKAKNDGQTVSIINGCLYLDYKFTGYTPTMFYI